MVSRTLTACLLGCLTLFPSPSLAQPRVAVSIRPLHSLAAGVMEGVGVPELVIKSGASPHGFALRPSQARLLSRAEVVFWGGALLEPHLKKILSSRSKGLVLALHTPRGMSLLGFRAFLEPRKGASARAMEPGKAMKHGGRAAYDPHYWLDPRNARVMVTAMAEALAVRDPDHAGAYRKNARRVAGALERLERELAMRLAPLGGRPYLVFHDAYRYFEERFGLRPLGAITSSPSARPGARRIARLRRLIRSRGVKCVFTEPQFSARTLRVVTEDATLAQGVLDPIGVGLKPGPELYFRMMRKLGESFRACLLPQ